MSDRDWTEDFAHENGNYQCACIHCGQFFFGHKRRVACKECAERTKPVLSDAECKNLVFYMGSDQMALVRAVEVSVLAKIKESS